MITFVALRPAQWQRNSPSRRLLTTWVVRTSIHSRYDANYVIMMPANRPPSRPRRRLGIIHSSTSELSSYVPLGMNELRSPRRSGAQVCNRYLVT